MSNITKKNFVVQIEAEMTFSILMLSSIHSKLPSYRNQSIDLHSKSIEWIYMIAILAFNELN